MVNLYQGLYCLFHVVSQMFLKSSPSLMYAGLTISLMIRQHSKTKVVVTEGGGGDRGRMRSKS